MAELLRFISTNLMFLFDAGGYRIVDSRSGQPSGDGLVVVESEFLRLRFVRDRSQMHVDLQLRKCDGEDWFGLGVVRRWLLGDRPGFDHLDESSALFLRDNLERLEDEVSRGSGCNHALARLRDERAARADELFGRPVDG